MLIQERRTKELQKNQLSLQQYIYFTPSLKMDDQSEFQLNKNCIDCTKELLFKDLKLMFLNGYLPSSIFNDAVENNFKVFITSLIDDGQNSSVSLEDISIRKNNQQDIHFKIIQNEFKQQQNKTILQDLSSFCSEIKAKSQYKSQESTLELILSEGLKVYREIYFHFNYSENRLNEQIIKRYIIHQILSKKKQQDIYELQYTEENEIKSNLEALLKQLSLFSPQFRQFVLLEYVLEHIYEKFNIIKILKILKNKSENEQNQEKINYLNFFLNTQKTAFGENFTLKLVYEELQKDSIPQKIAQCKENEMTFTFLHKIMIEINDRINQFQLQQDHLLEDFLFKIKNHIKFIMQQQHFHKLKLEIDQEFLEKLIIKEVYNQAHLHLLYVDNILSEGSKIEQNVRYLLIENLLCQKAEKIIAFLQQQQIYDQKFIDKIDKAKQKLIESFILKVVNKQITISDAFVCLFRRFEEIANDIIKNQQDKFGLQLNYPIKIIQYLENSYEKEVKINHLEQKIQFEVFVISKVQDYLPLINEYKIGLDKQLQKRVTNFKDKFANTPQINQFLQDIASVLGQVHKKLFDLFVPFVGAEEFFKLELFQNSLDLEFHKLETNFYLFTNQINQYSGLLNSVISRLTSSFQMNEQEQQNIQKLREQLIYDYENRTRPLFVSLDEPSKQIFLMIEQELLIVEEKFAPLLVQLVTTRLQIQFIEAQNEKTIQLMKVKELTANSFIPFVCIQASVLEQINRNQDYKGYLQKFKDYAAEVEQTVQEHIKILEKFFRFCSPDQKFDNWRQFSQDWLKQKYPDLNFTQVSKNNLLCQLIDEMNRMHHYTNERLEEEIELSQYNLLNNIYLKDIFLITQQQCDLILIKSIKLKEISYEDLQNLQLFANLQVEFKSIRFLVQNPIELKNQILLIFKEKLLQPVLDNYQNQIEQHLNNQNEIESQNIY